MRGLEGYSIHARKIRRSCSGVNGFHPLQLRAEGFANARRRMKCDCGNAKRPESPVSRGSRIESCREGDGYENQHVWYAANFAGSTHTKSKARESARKRLVRIISA